MNTYLIGILKRKSTDYYPIVRSVIVLKELNKLKFYFSGTYLQDTFIEIEGLKIYGTPWQSSRYGFWCLFLEFHSHLF